ncbi:nucleotide pyrophosphohydrolase [Alloiococcus sp. CFN-8]|uniref:nucleotide pyrophosphohydrolase n=1 Tax=Alloiococcus sp. CFN-8 TaxID=3416081 RepID=UPI003CF93804
MDKDITIEELKNKVQVFCEVRDWDQFHNPKDLAIGISTEAGELLDIFRFKTQEQMDTMLQDKEKRESIEEEVSDIFYFILRFAQLYDIDLAKALIDKLAKNDLKYPVEKSKGKNNKYNEI